MDVIAVRGIRAYGRHGANPGERDREQPFDVELMLEIDLRAAQRSDDIDDTLDYAKAHHRIAAIVRSTSFALLERLAGRILDEVFVDERIARGQVEIAKPGILDGATPSVRLRRDNPQYREAQR